VLRARVSIAAAIASLVLAACGSFGGGPVPSGAAVIGMVNATSMPVAMHVNGAWVGTYPAWSEQRAIPVFGPGGPPWNVEFRDQDGFVIGSVVVDGPATDESASSGWTSSCGQFTAWWGPVPDTLPVLDPEAGRPPPPPCT